VNAPNKLGRIWLMLDGVADGFVSYEELAAATPAVPLPTEVEGADMLSCRGLPAVRRGLNGRCR